MITNSFSDIAVFYGLCYDIDTKGGIKMFDRSDGRSRLARFGPWILPALFVLLMLGAYLYYSMYTPDEAEVRKAFYDALEDCYPAPSIEVSELDSRQYDVTVRGWFAFRGREWQGDENIQRVESALKKIRDPIKKSVGSVRVVIPSSKYTQESRYGDHPEYDSERISPNTVVQIDSFDTW